MTERIDSGRGFVSLSPSDLKSGCTYILAGPLRINYRLGTGSVAYPPGSSLQRVVGSADSLKVTLPDGSVRSVYGFACICGKVEVEANSVPDEPRWLELKPDPRICRLLKSGFPPHEHEAYAKLRSEGYDDPEIDDLVARLRNPPGGFPFRW